MANASSSDSFLDQLTTRLNELRLGQLPDEAELPRTIRELRIHQIELEMQAIELREAKTRIEESRTRYADLYDSAPVGYVTLDGGGCIHEINLTGARMLAIEPLRAIGRPFLGFVEKADLRRFLEVLAICRKTRSSPATELRLTTVDGTPFVADLSGTCRPNSDGTPYCYFTLTDITDRKRLEEHHLTLSKLDGLSIMAGGIAHDFNNLLTVILGNVELARRRSDPEFVAEKLDQIKAATLNAKGLARKLLTFAKGGSPVREVTDLGNLVTMTASLVFSGSPVAYVSRIGDTVWPIRIDASQIGQAVHNILMNAREACADGGNVEIDIDEVTLPGDGPDTLDAGEYLRVTVTDTGYGMTPEVRNKIFDPYFTTKENGHGLGLAVAYSVVRQHDGTIAVESTLGWGTRMSLFLPTFDRDAWVTGEEGARSAPVVRKAGRVLVMDDEAGVRETMRDALEALDQTVVLAAHGKEAVAKFTEAQTSGHPFDLVILDMTIRGGMGGLETLEAIRKLDPRVRAVACSGYSDSPILARFTEYGFCGRLKKPFTLADIEALFEHA